MKNFEVRAFIESAKKINLSAIKNEKVRSKLFKISLDVLAANRRIAEKEEDLRAVILTPVMPQLEQIERLRVERSRETDVNKQKEIDEKIESFKEVIEPYVLFKQKYEEFLKEEFKVDTINKDDFVAAISKLDNIDLSVLSGFYPILS